MTSTQTPSSEIPSLEKKANDLDGKVEYWTLFSNRFVAGTAIATLFAACAAVGYFIGQKRLVLRTKQAAMAHADLSAAKDRENAATISRVRAEAATESKRIEGQAKKDIEAANRKSEEISAKATLEAARLTKQNLKTEARLEKERSQRVELEKSIGNRWLTKYSPADLEPLQQFSGTHVRVESDADKETILATNQLVNILNKAGWKVDSVSRVLDGVPIDIFDGIIVSPILWIPEHTKTEKPEDMQAYFEKRNVRVAGQRQAQLASRALMDFLKANDWQAREQSDWLQQSQSPTDPMNVIRIRIGAKPNTYFFPEELKRAMQERNKIDEEIQKRTQEAERRTKEIEDGIERRRKEFENRSTHPPLVLRPPEPEKPKE